MRKKHTKKTARKKTRKPENKLTGRSGSNAGRGFRYQDAVSAWLAVEIWAGQRTAAIMIPEGGDDVELRGEVSSLVQVKSRRSHLGDFLEGVTAGNIQELWARSPRNNAGPRFELILEREVANLALPDGQSTNCPIEGSIKTRLSKLKGAEDLLPKTAITVAGSPQERAISLIVNRIDCTPITAQMCFAELLVRVGALADANGRLTPENYRGLSVSDTEITIRHVLSAINVDAIEQAIRDGVCEPVDFLTPLEDPNFYLGVDVEPGHIAAGLVSERPRSSSAMIKGIEQRRAALVVGPSGAGKSALMWETANILRHTVRWFRVRRLNTADIPTLRQLIRTFRASEESPLGFVMDDIGRNGPESWGALLKEVMSVPGVLMLGSVREEDVTLIAERARAAEVRAEPNEELAERIWQKLSEAGKTSWAGWREPWQQSDGLILEYVHVLTSGRRLGNLLSDQVAARVSDPARVLELDILRTCAWAGAANTEIDSARLARTFSVSEAELSRSMQRLIEEHLVRSPNSGKVAGLHQIRSENLWRLTHETALPTMETSFDRTVASVPAKDLEPLIADALSKGRLPVPAVLDSLTDRLEAEPDTLALASALRGLGSGRISSGVDEWLDSAEVGQISRTQVGTAAMFGVAGINLDNLVIIPEIKAAADMLSEIKGYPEADPRRLLAERISPSTISALINISDMEYLSDILAALVGMPLSEQIRESLMSVPENLQTTDLHLVGSVLGTLSDLDRELASLWVSEVGEEHLFKRVQDEIAWAGPVTIDDDDDGVTVRCDFWYVAGSAQNNPHDAVVNLCELIMALCPTADFAASNAITASGELAGLAELPLATKRISRENLPPQAVPLWNKRWMDLIARRVAAPSYSDYLERGVTILDTLVPALEKIFDAHLRGKDVLGHLADKLNSLKTDSEALTPPAVSPLEALGTGSGESNTSVTTFQNLLHSTSVALITRFAKLPDQAGAYIAWVGDLIADVKTTIAEEPWKIVGNGPPLMLTKLESLLGILRVLAGESHERQEPPAVTWASRGKGARAGNAAKLVYLSAKTAGETRLSERKAEIERRAKETGIAANFYLRINVRGILPWPPVDVLALLPASDLTGAVIALTEQTELLRSLLDFSTHLTIMPSIEGVAFPALAKSGYQTLFPDAEAGAKWADQLGLQKTSSVLANLYSEISGLASELGSMEQIGLGAQTRPYDEIAVRRCLEVAFERKSEELTQQLRPCDPDLQSDVFNMIARLRTGEIDFTAEAQCALTGSASEIVENHGLIALRLIDFESSGEFDPVF